MSPPGHSSSTPERAMSSPERTMSSPERTISSPAEHTTSSQERSTITIHVGVLAFQGAFAEHCEAVNNCWHLMMTSQQSHGDQMTLDDLDLTVREVRTPEDLLGLQGLILPGGESTTMSLFLDRNEFYDALKNWLSDPCHVVFGTCAGLILLSNRLHDVRPAGPRKIRQIGGIDITCTRNLYGRQCESFERPLVVNKNITATSSVQNGNGKMHNGTPADSTRQNGVEKHAGSTHTNGVKTNGSSTYSGAAHRGVFIRAPGIHTVDSDDVTVLATFEDDGKQRIVAAEQGNVMVTSFHPELTDDVTWHRYFINKILSQRPLATQCDN